MYTAMMNMSVNLFSSILATVIFLRDDTVCLDSLPILYVDSDNALH